ncbi:hypothetical protein M0657_004805 [Pyricularia oryzae]|uniref:Uncharacterized protein n=1 Tax=Pyricularia oryzae TaxID=318829 RepID=A0A4P7MZH9_PYROR|nr:hypothetical protein M9X92_004464 [Pyricularia oryzae]KAI7924134.1 hypothetical protein M0657_004805 [Pyricularia oryzae]QBZ54571.1 hypothetical protein PoMZ_10274 [Pyricularia oryzae]
MASKKLPKSISRPFFEDWRRAILIHFASLPEYCLILFSSQIEVIHKLHIQLQLRRLASNPWRKDSRKEF